MKYRLITEYTGFIKSREEQDNIEYYDKYYVKNKHEGAECGCVYLDEKIKIKVFGVNDNDHSKDESGEMHVHIYTEFGESEYYVDYKNHKISYKDGYKLSDDYVGNLHNVFSGKSSVDPDASVYSCVYTSWNFENYENKKAIK